MALAKSILILGISQADDRESQWIEAGYVVGSKMLVSSFQTTKFNTTDIQRIPGAGFLAHWALHTWLESYSTDYLSIYNWPNAPS